MARYSGRVSVQATRIIDAPITAVWAQVADFAHWDSWNPWLALASDAKTTLSEKTAGMVKSYAWDSSRAGSGGLEQVRWVEHASIEQRMRLKHPFGVHGRSNWKFVAVGDKTEVCWEMRGRVNFSMRAFAQTVKGAIALDFRYGLDKLADLLEPADAPRYTLSYGGVVDVPSSRYVYRTFQGPIHAVTEAGTAIFSDLRQQLREHGVNAVGAPIAVYVETNIKTKKTKCYLGLPIGASDVVGSMAVREMAAHRAVSVCLHGGYTALEIAWYQTMQRLTLEAVRPDQRIAPFERYVVVAADANGNDALTELHIPIARPMGASPAKLHPHGITLTSVAP